MKRRLGVLLGVLIAFVVGLLGVPASQATTFEHSGTSAAYAYDGQSQVGPSSDTAQQRAPPIDGYTETCSSVSVDHRSNGVSARPGTATPPADSNYDDPTPLVQVAGVAPNVQEPASGAAEAPSSLARGGVAANTGRTAARACSFAGATTVLMADGTRKPIEDIEVGDKVIATDPETGEQVAKRVEHVFVHDDTVIDLVVDGEVITTTEDHPFWSVTDQRFERADELSPGEKVLAADGRVISVSGLQRGTAREALAYNLSVQGIHTYHVGDDEILVHNNCFTSLDALNNPKSLEGLTPSQVDDLARNAGFEIRAGNASAKNPATRYYLPGTNGSQEFRVLPQGVPGQPGVKSGAYLKYFGGPLHGTRVPLGMP